MHAVLVKNKFQQAKNFRRRLTDQSVNPESEKVWLTSFTDLMALMLTFFVMLYAMSDPKKNEITDFMTALRGQMGIIEGRKDNPGPYDLIEMKRTTTRKALDLSYLKPLLEQRLSTIPGLSRARIYTVSEGLSLSVPEDLLFVSNKDELSPEGQNILAALAQSFRSIKNRITIVGHTGTKLTLRQEGTGPAALAKSNWGLSLIRARRVATALNESGYTGPLSVMGAANGRHSEFPSSMPQATRETLARSIDFVLSDENNAATARFR